MPRSFSLEDIEIRKPVWIAMSDLFLDTDVRIWYTATARTLANSSFSFEELETIFRTEVRPAVESNLMQVAGEWAGFDADWLVSTIVAHDTTSRSFGGAERDWHSVLLLTKVLRGLDPARRVERVALWDKLSRLFLDRAPKIEPPSEGWPPAEQRNAIWRDEMWPAYSHAIKAYYRWSSACCPSEEEVQDAWKRLF